MKPIDYDESCGRYYVPVHPNWEIQTKGNGSSFRIANTTEDGRRVVVVDEELHDILEEMARDINAEMGRIKKQRDELVKALSICAKKFRRYEEIHAAKPDPIKAANNAALAKMAEDVIAKVEGI